MHVCVFCEFDIKYLAEYLDNKNIFRGLFSGAVIPYLHTNIFIVTKKKGYLRQAERYAVPFNSAPLLKTSIGRIGGDKNLLRYKPKPTPL